MVFTQIQGNAFFTINNLSIEKMEAVSKGQPLFLFVFFEFVLGSRMIYLSIFVWIAAEKKNLISNKVQVE